MMNKSGGSKRRHIHKYTHLSGPISGVLGVFDGRQTNGNANDEPTTTPERRNGRINSGAFLHAPLLNRTEIGLIC